MQWYTGDSTYDTLLLVGFGLVALILLSGFFGTAQYGGRFGGRGKGVKLGSKAGWVAMEVPALLFFPAVYFLGERALEPVPLFFLALWMLHYSNRALITPLLMRVQPGSQSSFAISVVLTGWIALALHSYFNAAYITQLGGHFTADWFGDPRFIGGLVVYVLGLGLNLHSDAILRNLRSVNPAPDEPRYRVPEGGGFRLVTCPQYLGEIIAFAGIALMTWNLGAVFVLTLSLANLVPRAIYTHQWFHKHFAEYPGRRKAIFPVYFVVPEWHPPHQDLGLDAR